MSPFGRNRLYSGYAKIEEQPLRQDLRSHLRCRASENE
jgi:hypothetical protein